MSFQRLARTEDENRGREQRARTEGENRRREQLVRAVNKLTDWENQEEENEILRN